MSILIGSNTKIKNSIIGRDKRKKERKDLDLYFAEKGMFILRNRMIEMEEEIERLNNIINELEKDMNNYYEEYKDVDDIVISENARVIKIYLDKLKELKENN